MWHNSHKKLNQEEANMAWATVKIKTVRKKERKKNTYDNWDQINVVGSKSKCTYINFPRFTHAMCHKRGIARHHTAIITTSMICGMYCCTQTAAVNYIYTASIILMWTKRSLPNIQIGWANSVSFWECVTQQFVLCSSLKKWVAILAVEITSVSQSLTVALVRVKKTKQRKQVKSFVHLC